MLSFLNRYLWIVITISGCTLVFLQHSKKHDLTNKLGAISKSKITHSSSPQRRTSPGRELTTTHLLEIHGTRPTKHHLQGESEFALAIGNATASDLIRLIDELDASPEPDENTKDLRDFLNESLGALDPLRALNREQNQDLQNRLFRSLAAQSPEKAHQWLLSAYPQNQPEHLTNSLIQARFIKDPATHVAESKVPSYAFREIENWAHLQQRFRPLVLPPDSLPEFASAIQKQERTDRNPGPILILMTSAAFDSIESAKTYAGTLNLDSEELAMSLANLDSHRMGSADLLDWAIEELDQSHSSLLQGYVSNFARRDLTGAGEWLDQADIVSAKRDPLLQQYSLLLAESGSPNANTWASKIRDRELREDTQREVFHSWERTRAHSGF